MKTRNRNESRLWVQYAYDDRNNAPIIQTASSEDEAREDDCHVVTGCWYCFEVIKGKYNRLINPKGPLYFTTRDHENTPIRKYQVNRKSKIHGSRSG